MDILGFACLGAMGGLGIVAVVFLLKQFLYVCRPNEIMIFSGRRYRMEDGSSVGYRVVHGGWAVRIPVLEKVDRMDLTTIPLQLEVQNAYSNGGIPLKLSAVAYVKVSSDPRKVNHAIERFLGRNPDEIQLVAKEALEGHLRGIVARMTPEEVNEDRLKFFEEMMKETSEDFDRLGLQLDTLKVQSVTDEAAYLDSIGRERLAQVLSSAEQSESTAKADAAEAQSQAAGEGRVAEERADTVVMQATNEFKRIVAELESQARSEEERAEQAGLAARARAEQILQEVRTRLEALRLRADVVLPAEARRRAAEMKSRADAAIIAADGEALAEVLRMLTEVWISAGDDAKDIFLIQQLEATLHRVVDRVKAIDIGEVTLLDRGDGRALAEHVASLPATVAAVFNELRHTTGIDVTTILSRTQEVRS